MHNTIKYIIDDQGRKSEVIVPITIWETLRRKKRKSTLRRMNSKKLSKHLGSIKLSINPLQYQKAMRNEWK